MAKMNAQPEGTMMAQIHEPGPDPAPFPPFDPANFTPVLIWLALTFGALYYLMSKIALPRVQGILHERQEKIQRDLNEAHDLREKAQAAAAQHDKTIAEARAKSQALAQENTARIHAETDAKRRAVEADLNAKLAAAEANIAEMKFKAMESVGEIAHEAASAIIQQLTGKAADQKAIAAAIASAKA